MLRRRLSGPLSPHKLQTSQESWAQAVYMNLGAVGCIPREWGFAAVGQKVLKVEETLLRVRGMGGDWRSLEVLKPGFSPSTLTPEGEVAGNWEWPGIRGA